jgi:cell division protein FtsX
MADSTVVIPPDIDAALAERATIWASLDQASANLKKIEELGGQIEGGKEGVQPAEALTLGKLPPTEVAAVLAELETELANIKQAEADIEKHKKEISSHKMTRTILIVLSLLLLLGMILVIASSVLGH